MKRPLRFSSPIFLALFLFAGTTRAQQPTITPDDYGQWESLGFTPTISPDGSWIVYQIRRVNEENELRLTSTDGDTTRALAYAEEPTFSSTSRWLAYSIGLSPGEREQKEEDEESIRDKLGVLDLSSGEVIVMDDVTSFAFSDDGSYLAYRKYAPEDRSSGDLIVFDPQSGTSTNFGNVAEYGWSDWGTLLAMTIDTESGSANGVHVYDPSSGSLQVLESSSTEFRALSWREDHDQLAVLKAVEDSAFADTTHIVRLWRGLASGDRAGFTLDPATAEGFPTNTRIAEYRDLTWSDDGAALYIGLRPREPASVEEDSTQSSEDEIKPSDVQIWHARDFRIIPMQQSQEQRDLRRTMLAVWHVDEDRFVQIGTDLMERVEVLSGDRFAVETASEPYASDEMFGRVYDDVYLVDLASGERRRILEKVRYFYPNGSSGRYVLYFTGEHFWVYDVENGTRRNITENLASTFVNREYDYPVQQYPSFGLAGWTTNDDAVWLYDKYDVWSVSPETGVGERLTDGAPDRAKHQRIRLDRDEETIDPDQDQYFQIVGEWSKQSGIARRRPGRSVERLIWEDARVSRLTKAKDADVFVLSRERFDDSPDLFSASGDLGRPRQISRTNPFQSDFAWGRAELIDYTSDTGRPLQGALYYPANHDPSRKYPMIVYQYEIRSTRLHSYVAPSERSYYNAAVWTQQGYFVLGPDIVYRGRDPGRSAVEAIVPAVQAVIDRGLVDAARIGLIGHSWGGYQAAYVPTQTNIFAASVAGAPLTNFLSMMGAIHWNPGLPETQHWETGQARMEVPFWEDWDAHIRNSPAAFIHQLETPMLMMFGDADGTVDWRQGVEFYNYARRAGREDFVMLVYPGEGHGLRKKENRIDYHRRILQWFGHYLKDEPAPEWMTRGVSYIDRKKEITAGNGRSP